MVQLEILWGDFDMHGSVRLDGLHRRQSQQGDDEDEDRSGENGERHHAKARVMICLARLLRV